MEDRLESMRGKLPSRAAMPAMLIAISQAALGAGIDNELIEPQNEIMRDFYVEKPIKVRMVGAYHEFGNFVSAVASLSRGVILTMRDISDRKSTRLNSSHVAISYAVFCLKKKTIKLTPHFFFNTWDK